MRTKEKESEQDFDSSACTDMSRSFCVRCNLGASLLQQVMERRRRWSTMSFVTITMTIAIVIVSFTSLNMIPLANGQPPAKGAPAVVAQTPAKSSPATKAPSKKTAPTARKSSGNANLDSLYGGCSDNSPSKTFCIGVKDNKISYKGLQRGSCIWEKDCELLIRADRTPTQTGTIVESVFWKIAMKKRNVKQTAKVTLTTKPYTRDDIHSCCTGQASNGHMIRDVVYMQVSTDGHASSRVLVGGTVEPRDLTQESDVYKPQQNQQNYGGYYTQTFISGREVKTTEDLTYHRKSFAVDFTGKVSVTAFHFVQSKKKSTDGAALDTWENLINGLTPINIFEESLIDKVGNNEKNDEGTNLLWLWILLAILFLLLLAFIIWLICRRKARDRKRYEQDDGTGRTVMSGTEARQPSKVKSGTTSNHRLSSDHGPPNSSPAGPTSSPETDSKATAGSLRSGMSNTTAASKASSGSKRSKMTSITSKSSNKSSGSTPGKYY